MAASAVPRPIASRSGPVPTPPGGGNREAQVTDASLAPVAAAATDTLPRTTELKETLRSVGTALLRRALDAGAVRRDLAVADLVPLMCGIAYAVNVHGGTPADRIDTAHRYLATLLEGLHATPQHA
ncbi:SbtR family transcriptional regulator [Streptomyces sp. NPDC054797]